MPEAIPKPEIKDVLTGMMIFDALVEFTCSDNESKSRLDFDQILMDKHNGSLTTPAQQAAHAIDLAYLKAHSLRVSQKFSQIKAKFKKFGEEIHLSLPRRRRSASAADIDAAKARHSSVWAKFQKLNKAAGKAK